MAAHSGSIQIERFQLLQDEISTSLRQTFAEQEAAHPQFGLDWLTNLAAHALDEGDQAVLFVARTSDTDLVALPLRISAQKQAQTLVNFYTSLYQPLVGSTEPAPLLEAILRHLRSTERLHSLLLHPLDSTADHFHLLQRALQNSGWRGIHKFTCFANWYLDSTGMSWQRYLAERPSRLRNTIGRKSRAFLRDGRGELNIVHGGEALPAAIAQYTAIYNSSWKQDEPYPQFMPNLVTLAAQRGWLRLGIACYDGEPIASQIWLVANETAYIFKLAYRPEAAQLSPGTVLTAHMMESVLEEDNVTCIDYLSGDDAYKRDWMSVRRERQGIAAYNPGTPRGLLQLLLEQGKRLAKSGAA